MYNEPFGSKTTQKVFGNTSLVARLKPNDYVAGTVTYKAEALGDAMGLSNLGDLPRLLAGEGQAMPTGSFKDMKRFNHPTHA